MTETPTTPLAEELSLTKEQVLTLRTLQARMLLIDLEEESGTKRWPIKRRALERFVTEAFDEVVALGGPAEWLPPELDRFGQKIRHLRPKLLASLAPALAEQVSERSAAVVILAELVVFSPWEDGSDWNRTARDTALRLSANDLAGVNGRDLDQMIEDFEGLMKALRRKSIKWGRLAVATVLGAGIGVASGGLAAPAIGTMIGTSMGLSGAAATSAGLAALGGGSLAAGGFGVAGGTILVSGVGGVAAAGAAAAGTRFSPFGSGLIAADAVKLDLIARVLLTGAPNRDEKMRRVVESLQESINILSDRTKLLVNKIDRLKREKATSEAENKALKEEIKLIKADLDAARAAETVLAVVRDRLPEATA